ncbi:MAG: thioesterase domain-containing protein [Cyanobacteria bacterium J06635_10]
MQLAKYTDKQVEKLLKDYIIKKFIYGAKAVLEDDLLLVEEGIINSIGILTLINYIAEQFDVSIASEEIVLNNFKDINSIKSLVLSKIQASNQQTIIKESTEKKLLSVVPVKPSGCKRPFFYIHGLGGHGSNPTLAKYIDSNRPFYGLQAIGLDGQNSLYTRIEDMVAHYIQEIKIVQPQDPYLLGGRCIGGNIAFEIARELKKHGEQVSVVTMSDTPNPFIEEQQRVDILNHWRLVGQPRWRKKMTEHGWSSTQVENFLRVMDANKQIIADYKPQLYSGRVVYFSAQENRDSIFDPMQANGWNSWVAGEIQIVKVPGKHGIYHEEPHVRVLAEKLNACLEEVDDVLLGEP